MRPFLSRVELEVERPHLIGTLCPQPRPAGVVELPRRCRLRRFAGTRRPSSRQSAGSSCGSPPSLAAPARPRAPVAPARMLAREIPQRFPERFVAIAAAALPPLRGAVLAGDPARPPLRQRLPLPRHRDGLASARRAHQFPLAIPFSPSISSSCSATIRFSFPLSRSSSFSLMRRRPSTRRAADPVVQRLLRHLKPLAGRCHVLTLAKQPVRLPQLPDNLPRRMPAFVLPVWAGAIRLSQRPDRSQGVTSDPSGITTTRYY